MLQKFSSSFIILFLVSLSAYSLEVPRLRGPVMDQAGIMSTQNKRKIESALKALNSSSGIQLQVLTLKTLEGDPIEEFSIRAVDKWKLGGQKNDRGALLLIAVNDRKMRIEVGDGLEGQIPDLMAGRIIDSMKPFFKNGDFDTGIYVGVASISQAAGVNLGDVKLTRSTRGQRKNKKSAYVNLIILVFFFLIFGFRRRGRSGIYFGGGGYGGGSSRGGFGGGGGGWSGGGGSFSGGGSSGSW